MRLLDTSTCQVTEDTRSPSTQKYAILSHRWRDGEILLQDTSSGRVPETHKIRRACSKAREQGLQWLWIDTCCIDKTNAVETARAINSMFEWYRAATICYAYLEDVAQSRGVSEVQAFQRVKPQWANQPSVWFERGWTLQELLAPNASMEFYDQNWQKIGTKHSLARALEQVTRIDRKILEGEADLRSASVAMRMSWMAGRVTTQVEDIAYSMLGILDVNMSIQYGEGIKAFIGLQEALMTKSTDESIFAWVAPAEGLQCYRNWTSGSRWKNWAEKEWGLLAPSPDCFKDSNNVVLPPPHEIVPRSGGGYRMAQQGVQFQMPMKSGTEATNMLGLMRKEITLALNCWKPGPDGKLQTVRINVEKKGAGYMRVQLGRLDLKKNAKPSTNSVMGIDQGLTRPLTIIQPELRL